MSYPLALVLAAVIVAGAVLWPTGASTQPQARRITFGPTILSSGTKSDAWMVMSDGRVVYCAFRQGKTIQCFDKSGAIPTP